MPIFSGLFAVVASVGAVPKLNELHAHFPSGGRRAEMAYRVSRQAVGDIDRLGSDQGGWRTMLDPLAAGTDFATALHSQSEPLQKGPSLRTKKKRPIGPLLICC